MTYPFYTIGHATRAIGQFVDLLLGVGITLVVDVRTVPRSRANPQYNQQAVAQSLAAFDIGYEHIAALGGLRSRSRDVPPGVNAFWRNESFHNYADYAMSDSFRAGLARLRELGGERCCAVMCAETLWWRCHRRIIADYLLAAGDPVFHILGPGHVEPARMSDAVRPGPSGSLIYPARSTQAAEPPSLPSPGCGGG